ncbi:hypothetical protein ACUNWD_06370 [Sunxiuqinia sp. A32]|uniref:hypothetical protein n=1 Tax=Sunxiuqinia sp. A32 TaxID=3461496 RepID=UPI00404534A9
MRQIKKIIGTVMLWLAGIILTAHSFIPHHHHIGFEQTKEACHQECCSSHDQKLENVKINIIELLAAGNQHEHDACNGCEFNAKTTSPLSKLSLDILNFSEQNSKPIIFSAKSTTICPLQIDHSSPLLSEIGALRGPPALG